MTQNSEKYTQYEQTVCYLIRHSLPAENLYAVSYQSMKSLDRQADKADRRTESRYRVVIVVSHDNRAATAAVW